MSNPDLWKKYCSFYDKSFQEQIENNNERLETYFSKWKKTDIAKKLDKTFTKTFKDVPITDYSDYPMLHSFSSELESATKINPRIEGESLATYYLRISSKLGSSLNCYMTEPFYFHAATTGSTGKSKSIANGETFWKNFFQASLATVLVSCTDEWGETKLKHLVRELKHA